jgi:Mrp family chromosome partitioning ATPase
VASSPQAAAGPDLNVERARLAALEARLKALTEQAKEVDSEVEKLTSSGVEFTNLERRRQLEEEKYRYSETSLEKARVDETLNPTSMPNITVVQKPSMPIKSIAATTKRIAIGLAVSGLLTGLGLAFLIEWVIDRRVSRPIEIRTRLQLPLMMSIPRIRSKDRIAKLIGRVPGRELMGDAYNLILPPEPPNGKGVVALRTKDSEHFIMPYVGAIRDRIMFNFELNNITHKPKLVALTSLSSGAGTSTIAAGLAKAFAENGNQKVLLVDLNPMLRGSNLPQHPAESLGTVLDISNAELFRQSSKSLYFASAPMRPNGKGSQALASVDLYELMPQLETCNFDYVVFDMPPVGPTSPTLAMAGFMDKVLLVLDAENTNRESLIWGYAELQKGRADVSCIFNKVQSHAPQWVSGDL